MADDLESRYSKERIDQLDATVSPFLTGPGEFLVQTMKEELLKIRQWKDFWASIDTYMRMDYGMRALPALRMYTEYYTKEWDSWWVNGTIIAEFIWPPNLRRDQLEQYTSTVAAAFLQQFRSLEFLENVFKKVPGLNELGKTFTVQKGLGFEWGENIVPLTRIELNFRLDLAVWDEFLESDNRTKDKPFQRTLGDLKRIRTEIEAQEDDGSVNVTVPIDQEI